MEDLKDINVFLFDVAQYVVGDIEGNKALLKVFYAQNSFEILGNGLSESATAELTSFAQDLLARKHAKNFADK